MSILTRWGFRMVRANRSRTVTTILVVVGFFALMTSSLFLTSGFSVAAEVTKRNGLFSMIENMVNLCAFFSAAGLLYSVFSVMAEECKQEYHILSSSGATVRQICRSLLIRSLALDLIGAALGVAIGITAMRIVFGTDVFRSELQRFFTDAHTVRTLALALCIPLCMMELAAWRAFLPNWSFKPHTPSQEMFRRSFARRVFGVGGALGRINCKNNRRYRALFTTAFAIGLAAQALLTNTLWIVEHAEMKNINADLCVSIVRPANDPSLDRSIDAFLQEYTANGKVESYTAYRTSYSWINQFYCLLDNDWMSDEALERQSADVWTPNALKWSDACFSFSQNGQASQLCFFSDLLFLDDASFDRLARENGIDTGENGVLLFNTGWIGKGTTPLLKEVDPQQQLTLHFQPLSFHYQSLKEQQAAVGEDDMPKTSDAMDVKDFLSMADPISVTKTVRVAGLLRQTPLDLSARNPALILPERMSGQFADILTDPAMKYSPELASQTLYLQTDDPEPVKEAIAQRLETGLRCPVREYVFGLGYRDPAESESTDPASDEMSFSAHIFDLKKTRESFGYLKKSVQIIRFVLRILTMGMLLAGILNAAYLNRLTRRREKAILTSIGMDRRQQAGMLLYESARYALRSTVFGFLGFAVCILFTRAQLLLDLDFEGLYEQGTTPDIGVFIPQVWFEMPRAIADACARTWWIFVGGAAVIFALLIVTDRIIERRSKREELIRILKDDFV